METVSNTEIFLIISILSTLLGFYLTITKVVGKIKENAKEDLSFKMSQQQELRDTKSVIQLEMREKHMETKLQMEANAKDIQTIFKRIDDMGESIKFIERGYKVEKVNKN